MSAAGRALRSRMSWLFAPASIMPNPNLMPKKPTAVTAYRPRSGSAVAPAAASRPAIKESRAETRSDIGRPGIRPAYTPPKEA